MPAGSRRPANTARPPRGEWAVHPTLSCCPTSTAGRHLTIKRLLLRNMSLSPAAATPSAGSTGPVPRLLPLGLVSGVPFKLTLVDVRLAVSDADFKEYLGLFLRELSTSESAVNTGARIHTVSNRHTCVTTGSQSMQCQCKTPLTQVVCRLQQQGNGVADCPSAVVVACHLAASAAACHTIAPQAGWSAWWTWRSPPQGMRACMRLVAFGS